MRTAVLPVSLALGVTLAMAAPPAVNEPVIEWSRNLNQAMERARSEGKPVLLDFTADWCAPCREMEATLWTRPEVQSLSRKFVSVRIQFDPMEGIAQRYRIEAIPAVVILDPWGTEIARRDGYAGPSEYLKLLQAMPGDFAPLAPWQERLGKDRNDFKALQEIGRLYHRLHLFHTSREFLERAARTKEARQKPEVLAEILTAIGWSHLKAGDARQARKIFQDCMKQVPNHPSLEGTLYGLVTACRVAGLRSEAEAALAQLEGCCAASPFLERARVEMGTVARSGG